ncbi:MAG TPA: cyanophycin synthetase, partial [Thermoanaerobaculia bacterium]|nr:cyanophycin synthetase [Thermoanaerobaculia bacterium]
EAISEAMLWVALVQLGHGKYQRRIQATTTSKTQSIASEIASDKRLTRQILDQLGLPVPRQEVVYDAGEAVEEAERIGYPVVLKPLDGNQGRGVSINLKDAEQVRAAFGVARDISRGVIVESFQPGNDYRILVVDGRVIAVAQRVPGHVVGDGRHTIAELVETVNRDPRRGVGHEKTLTRLEIDHQAHRLLAQAGLTLESVLPEGEVFYLRSTGNLSTGGTSIDKTDAIHYDNRIMAERGVKAIGLDVAGVDFVSPDISRSYKEVGGAIVEINAAPGFRMHTAPTEGKARDVAGPVIDMLFPNGTPCRIPIAAITGTNGKTTTTRMVGHILKLAGHTVGMTTTDGVYIDGVLTVRGDMTGPWSSQLVLRDPTIDTAVLETARGGILRSGLGWRRCSVGAVLNVAADHLGLAGIDSVDDLAKVKQVVVEVAQDYCVLNADDPRVARMAEQSPAEPIYVTMDRTNELVRKHVLKGGKAVALEEGLSGAMLALYQGEEQIPLVLARQIPATVEGRARHNVQNAMFAAAIAVGMGVDLEDIRQGLRTFSTDFFQAPGRLNFYNEYPFRVLLDYAHNAHGMEAVARMVRELAVHGRRIGVIGAPGDRRDEDIRATAAAAAPAFDLMLLREDDDLRGRQPGEVADLLREGLVGAGFPAERIIPKVHEESEAVESAMEMARAGDLVVIFGDRVTRDWELIVGFGKKVGIRRRDEPAVLMEAPEEPVLAGMGGEDRELRAG